MKVLFITFEFPPVVGGIAQFAFNTAEWLGETGLNLSVMTPYRDKKKLKNANIKKFFFPRNKIFRIISSILSIFKEVVITKYDLIILTDMRTFNIYSLFRILLPRKFIPVFHGQEVFVLSKPGFISSFRKRCFRELINKSLVSVVVSKYVKNLLVEKLDINEEKIKVIPHGIDQENFRCKDKNDKNVLIERFNLKGKTVLLTISRLIKDKRHEFVINTLDKYRDLLKDFIYIIVGDGPEKENLEFLVKRLKLTEQIYFFGPIEIRDKRKPCLYEIADVFVMPSRRESFGISFIESGAVGTPSIGTCVGGITEIIEDGKNGFIIPEDQKILFERLRILVEDKNLLNKMKKESKKIVKKRFDKYNITSQWRKLFNCFLREDIHRKDKKPIILHLLTNVNIGGAEKALLRAMKLYDKEKFCHIVVTILSKGRLFEKFKNEGFDIQSLNMKGYFDIFVLIRYIKLLRKRKPQIIIAYLFHALTIAVLGKIFYHNAILVHSKRNVTLGSKLRDLLNRLYTFFIDYLIGVAKGTFTNESKLKFKKNYNKFLVYNGITIPDPVNREVCNDPIMIGTIARLHYQKGIIYLLGAAKEVKKQGITSRFIIIGGGEKYNELKEVIKKQGLEEEVDLKGEILGIEEFLKRFDIFVLPSLFEGFSNVILEAMSFGIPVVATDISGTNEVIKNNVNGLLVSPMSSSELAEAIIKLIRNPALRKRLGEAGRRTIERRFSINGTVRFLESIFENVISQN